jgi:hypothetical protein
VTPPVAVLDLETMRWSPRTQQRSCRFSQIERLLLLSAARTAGDPDADKFSRPLQPQSGVLHARGGMQAKGCNDRHVRAIRGRHEVDRLSTGFLFPN